MQEEKKIKEKKRSQGLGRTSRNLLILGMYHRILRKTSGSEIYNNASGEYDIVRCSVKVYPLIVTLHSLFAIRWQKGVELDLRS